MVEGHSASETDTVAVSDSSFGEHDTQSPTADIGTVDTQLSDSEAPTLLPGEAEAKLPGLELARGQAIDRYVVLDRIGAGGMGVVLSAFDPDLDRKVAIKLLKPGASRGSAWEGQQRLLREAQAMAKLSHPNVVTVHDVGIIDDTVFVAMEFVVGATLRGWLREEERARRDILETFIAAGRGLAAAHQAGLVHRDFKPDNVMVGDDGQIRVMDFGLASVEGSASSVDDAMLAAISNSSTRQDSTLTRSGAVMGTPAYMSPEQFAGKKAGPATDQFAFCVALYEALYGERPFAGSSMHALAVAVSKGEMQSPPAGRVVPARLHKSIVRGLASSPNDRWPSMDALISALGDEPSARRRSYALVAAGVVAAAGLFVFGQKDEERPCRDMDALVTDVWGGKRAAQLSRAYEASSVKDAGTLAASTTAGLDAYVHAWVETRTDACEATHVRGEQSAELMDLRMACLDRRRGELAAVIEVLAEADPAVIERAPDIVGELTGLEHCSDKEALLDESRPPEDAQDSRFFREAQAYLDKATARDIAGQYEEGLEVARRSVELAEQIDWPPLQAETYYRLGTIQAALGEYETAEQTLVHAFRAALAGRRFDMISFAALELTSVIGADQGRIDDALEWAGHAESATAGVGMKPEHEMRLHDTFFLLLNAKNEHAQSLQRARRALEICEREMPEDDECRRTLPSHVANALDRTGDHQGAIEIHEENVGQLRSTFGADHPEIGAALYNLALAYEHKGDLDSARRRGQEALEQFRRTLGEDHPNIGSVLNVLSNIERLDGNLERAIDIGHQSLEASKRALGPDHPANAAPHSVLSVLYRNLEDLDNAEFHMARVVELREKQGDPLNAYLAFGYSSLADILLAQGQPQEALDALDKAHAIERKRAVEEPSWRAELWGLTGIAQAAVGHTEAAIEALETASAEDGFSALPIPVQSKIEFELAKNLPAKGASAARRFELANEALARLNPDEDRKAPGSSALSKEIRRWLADNPG